MAIIPINSYYPNVNQYFSNADIFEIFYMLVQQKKEKTLKNIYDFIYKLLDPDYGTNHYYSDFALDYEIESNYGYFLLMLCLGNYVKPTQSIDEFNSIRTIFINFLTVISYIKNNFSCFNIENKQICLKRIEKLINLIIQENEMFIWHKSNSYNIYYYDVKSLLENDFDLYGNQKIKNITNDKYHTYLTDDFGKILIEDGVRKLHAQPSFNRFKTIYKALSNALKICKNRKLDYCPWCNPDELLPHTERQRKIDVCKDISNFIVSNSSYTSKNLNNHIRSIKSKENDVDTTRLQRGKELLKILKEIDNDMLRNEKNIPEGFAKIVEMTERQYGIDFPDYFSFE